MNMQVREPIEQSHQRCAALGLSPRQRPDFAPLARAEFAERRERNRRLHAHAAPVMEMLCEQVAGTQSMVLLTDACGIVIHTHGDDDFLARAQKVALRPGADWSEPAKGTNAIGTALVAEAPTLVHADEHFLQANHFLTCSAVPIHDPRGNVAGVLDVTGERERYHRHTMGLVRLSARMIENHWLADEYRHELRLHLHARADCLGTLMEGILALSPQGRVLAANREAHELLGMSGGALRMQSVSSLFGIGVDALHEHFRSPSARPLSLRLADGRPLVSRARFEWTPSVAVTAPSGDDAAADPPPTPVPMPPVPAAPRRRGDGGLHTLDSGDAQVHAVIGKLERVIDRSIPILIGGETGTGKELLARAIHAASSRASMPFVAVNCAAIPDSLIEAELFGYEDGAFTGARRRGAVGKVVQAHGGTLFLDEIGDMPLALQARLLRVLQERQVTPLGGSKPVAVDVAIVSASHCDLRSMVREGHFREDLYYRLNGVSVKLPPLRARSDLEVLVQRMLAGTGMRLSAALAERFAAYRWPGNLRQLDNVLRAAVALAGAEAVITEQHLCDDFLEELDAVTPAHEPAPPAGDEAEPAATSPSTLEQAELDMIRRAVEAEGGNISAASKRLGIARNTIYRRLRWNVEA